MKMWIKRHSEKKVCAVMFTKKGEIPPEGGKARLSKD
jgi:hypothetical protein